MTEQELKKLGVTIEELSEAYTKFRQATNTGRIGTEVIKESYTDLLQIKHRPSDDRVLLASVSEKLAVVILEIAKIEKMVLDEWQEKKLKTLDPRPLGGAKQLPADDLEEDLEEPPSFLKPS